MQSKLDATETELTKAKEAEAQTKLQAADLAAELRKADGQRIDLREKLDQANIEIQRLISELQRSEAGESSTAQ